MKHASTTIKNNIDELRLELSTLVQDMEPSKGS